MSATSKSRASTAASKPAGDVAGAVAHHSRVSTAAATPEARPAGRRPAESAPSAALRWPLARASPWSRGPSVVHQPSVLQAHHPGPVGRVHLRVADLAG